MINVNIDYKIWLEKMAEINYHNTIDFQKKCKMFGIDLSKEQTEKFMDYYELLIEWNSFMNLTAITDFDEVILKHFVDSLAVCQTDIFRNVLKKSDDNISDVSLIDIGTGAGFPGIPLKIIFSDMQITLLDSLNKRINFLNTVIEKLDLKGIRTVHGRAEDFARQPDYREQYDFCVSRAVANLSTLTELCIPFVKKGGYFIPYKSERVKEELAAGEKAMELLGGKIENILEYQLPDSDINRNLLLIRKEKNTPKRYPRKAGTPAKEPLC